MSDSSSFSLQIVAGAHAFGHGRHPSTRAAIVALEALSHLDGVQNVLDMGCGSGILGLQAAYFWHAKVLMADSEASAIEACMENARANQLHDLVQVVRSVGFDHPAIRQKAPYDLILCNILAETLVALARDLAEHLAEEGVAVLSGMLQWQDEPVIAAYQAAGLTLLQRVRDGDWVCLLWQKP